MQNTADTTLLALEQRLQRLHFLLHGDSLDDDASEQQLPLTANNTSASIAARLTALEKSLHTIVANSQAAAELLRLRKTSQPMSGSYISTYTRDREPISAFMGRISPPPGTQADPGPSLGCYCPRPHPFIPHRRRTAHFTQRPASSRLYLAGQTRLSGAAHSQCKGKTRPTSRGHQ